jgi:hypothetical protein
MKQGSNDLVYPLHLKTFSDKFPTPAGSKCHGSKCHLYISVDIPKSSPIPRYTGRPVVAGAVVYVRQAFGERSARVHQAVISSVRRTFSTLSMYYSASASINSHAEATTVFYVASFHAAYYNDDKKI